MDRSTTNESFVVTCAALAIAALGFGSSIARAAGDDWRLSITPYLWLPSVNTKLSVKDQPIDVQTDTEAPDILSKLDFAMLVTGEVAKDKVGVFYDFEYLKLSDDGTVEIKEPRHFD